MTKKNKDLDVVANKENSFNDVTVELDVDIENEDGIDSILDIINSSNLEEVSEALLMKYKINVGVETIEEMIETYELDQTSDRFYIDLYNLYMKFYND